MIVRAGVFIKSLMNTRTRVKSQKKAGTAYITGCSGFFAFFVFIRFLRFFSIWDSQKDSQTFLLFDVVLKHSLVDQYNIIRTETCENPTLKRFLIWYLLNKQKIFSQRGAR